MSIKTRFKGGRGLAPMVEPQNVAKVEFGCLYPTICYREISSADGPTERSIGFVFEQAGVQVEIAAVDTGRLIADLMEAREWELGHDV